VNTSAKKREQLKQDKHSRPPVSFTMPSLKKLATNPLHSSILLPFLLNLIPTFAQNSDRNCTANETISSLSETSYNILNATGTYSFEGFGGRRPGSLPPGNWTWSIGFQNIPNNNASDENHWYEKVVWIDTHGVDLADEDLDYEMCHILMSGWEDSVQEKGQGDSGKCEKFLGEECAEDWRKALINQAVRRNTEFDTPCDALKSRKPESCKDSAAGRSWGCKSSLAFEGSG
jgi:hypothetical protein